MSCQLGWEYAKVWDMGQSKAIACFPIREEQATFVIDGGQELLLGTKRELQGLGTLKSEANNLISK